jgi:hypothetical protein
VAVRGIRNRHGAEVFFCTTDDECEFPVLEVPQWMFDPIVCGIQAVRDLVRYSLRFGEFGIAENSTENLPIRNELESCALCIAKTPSVVETISADSLSSVSSQKGICREWIYWAGERWTSRPPVEPQSGPSSRKLGLPKWLVDN